MSGFPCQPGKHDPAAITVVEVDRFIVRMSRITQGSVRILLWLEEIDDAEIRSRAPFGLISGPLQESTK